MHNNGEDYQFKLKRYQEGVDLLGNLGLSDRDYGWFIDPHKPELINFAAAFIRHSNFVTAVSIGQMLDYLRSDNKGCGEGLKHIFEQLMREKRLFGLANGVFLRELQKKRFGMSMFDILNEPNLEKRELLTAEFIRIAEEKEKESKQYIANYSQYWPSEQGQSPYVNENCFLINFIGRPVEQKGLQFLIPFAWKVLSDARYQDVAFIVAISGKNPDITSRLEELKHVFPGRFGYTNDFLKGDTYAHSYGAGNSFSAPSTFEPGGITPMESLAYGVPCIVSHKQGLISTVKTIHVAQFADLFGTDTDEPGFNGVRFPIDEWNLDNTVNNMFIAFNAKYQIWKERAFNKKWERMRRNALLSDNSWDKALGYAKLLFNFTTTGNEEYFRQFFDKVASENEGFSVGSVVNTKLSTFLVVGGAGYVGSHTVAHLVKQGYRVVVYDSCIKGHKDAVIEGADFVQADVSDIAKLEATFAKYHPDAVYFFAAHSLVPESVSLPAKYYANNIVNSLALLDVMNKYGCSSFIYSSSAATYGQPENNPINETFPNNPVQAYGDTKFLLEEILNAYSNAYGIKATFLRYFNVFGAAPEVGIGEDHTPETHIVPLLMQLPLIELILKELIILETNSAVISTAQFDAIRVLIDSKIIPEAASQGSRRTYLDMKSLVKIYTTLRNTLLHVRKANLQIELANQQEVIPVLEQALMRAQDMGLLLDGAMPDPLTGQIISGIDVATEDGTPVRDYVDAWDLAQAHEFAYTKGLSGPYNCGTNTGYSAKQISEGVKDVLSKDSPNIRDPSRGDRLIVMKARKGDPAALVASFDKLNKESGWKPQTTYIKSLENAWVFLKTHLTGYNDEAVLLAPCEVKDTEATIKAVTRSGILPADLKFEILFRFLTDVFESEPATAKEAVAFARACRKTLDSHKLGGYETAVLTDKELIAQYLAALNALKDITKRQMAVKLSAALGINEIVSKQVKSALGQTDKFDTRNRFEIFTKPVSFISRQPIIRRDGKYFDSLINIKAAPVLTKQLKAAKKMWERFEASMHCGPRYDVLVFDTEEWMYEINKAAIEALRGIAYHEDTTVILVINPDGYFKDNLNAVVAEMKTVRDLALPSLGLDLHKLKINHILLAGRGTRNEPFTHALGLGGKHLMLNPSAFSYIASTIIQSYQVFKNKPHWLGRFNDQIILITNPKVFSGKQGLITGGLRYNITPEMLFNPDDPVRNNCLMKLGGDSSVIVAREKPLATGDNCKDKNGLAYYVDKKGKAAGSLSVRLFSHKAVNTLINEFTKVNSLTGNYIYESLRLNENTALVGGSTFNDEERDNFWATHDHSVKSGAKYEDVIAAVIAARNFKKKVGIGFGDFGPEGEAIFIDTGKNSTYYDAFMELTSSEAIQALLDIVPDKDGNVVIGSHPDAQSLIKGKKNIFVYYCPNLKSGDIGNGSVLLNLLCSEIITEGNCLVASVYENGKVVHKGEVLTQIYQKEENSPFDIRWNMQDDSNKFFKQPVFGHDNRTYDQIKEGQDKKNTIRVLQAFNPKSYDRLTAEIIKSLSLRQRKIGFVKEEFLTQIRPFAVGNFAVNLLEYRDPNKYTQGINFVDPISEAEAKESYGVQQGIEIWKRAVERKELKARAQEAGISKCNICPAFMPAIEELLYWGNWHIAIQPFPFSTKHHFVFVNKEHRPQVSIGTEDLLEIVDFSSQIRGVRLFYNGVGASITGHLHLQGLFETLPIERAPTRMIIRKGNVLISELADWPIVGFVFESDNSKELARELSSFVGVLKRMDLLKGETKERSQNKNGIDLLFVNTGSGIIKAYVIPRSRYYPQTVWETVPFGTPDAGGLIIIFNNKELSLVNPCEVPAEKAVQNINAAIREIGYTKRIDLEKAYNCLIEGGDSRSSFDFVINKIRKFLLARMLEFCGNGNYDEWFLNISFNPGLGLSEVKIYTEDNTGIDDGEGEGHISSRTTYTLTIEINPGFSNAGLLLMSLKADNRVLANFIYENEIDAILQELKGFREKSSLLKYPDPRDPGLKLDDYDKKHYFWDAATGYWRSKDYPRLVLGSQEDIRHSEEDDAAPTDMENHVAIRMSKNYTIYVFDAHSYSERYLHESEARGELPRHNNQQIFIDDHFDTQDIGDPDARVAKDIAEERWLNNHIWVYFDYSLKRSDSIISSDEVLKSLNLNNSRVHSSHFFEIDNRPKNTRVIFNIDTDAADSKPIADFIAEAYTRDNIFPATIHISTSPPNCTGEETYGTWELDGICYPDGFGTIERCQNLVKDLPKIFASGSEDNRSQDENNQGIRVVNRSWECIKNSITNFDAAVAQKKESFLSRFYHAMERTFKELELKVKESKIDPLVKLNLMKYSQEDDKSDILHDAEEEIKIGFLPVASNPLNWGHILIALMGMNVLELNSVVLRVQGEISYKNLLASERVSIKDRHFTTIEAIKGLFPLVRYTDLGSEEDNSCEGTEEMYRFLELNKERKLHIFYILGAENEQRMWNYMRQHYGMMTKYNFGANTNHRVTFAVIQRGEYGKTVTLKELEDISCAVQKEFGQKNFLNITLVQDPDIDLNVSSTYYRNTQDGAFIPKVVHEFAKAHGYYGNPPVDPSTGKPITDSREQYFRMLLEPIAREIAHQIEKKIDEGLEGNIATVSIDGGSGSGKTTIAQEVAKYLKQERELDTEIIPLDMFLKNRIWRLAIQKLVTGRQLKEEEKIIVGELAGAIKTRETYVNEEDFFDHAEILNTLQRIGEFRKSNEERFELFFPNAYNQITKEVGPKTFNLKKKIVIIFEGKYANREELQNYFDLRYRLHDAPDRTEARFQIRSRKLSPNDADMQIVFYGLSLVPSYEIYDKRTEGGINGFIDLRGEEWFLKDKPNGGSLKVDITGYLSAIQEKFFLLLSQEGFMAKDKENIVCMVATKLLAIILSKKFGLPIGGIEPNRIEATPGYYFIKDQMHDYHFWIAIYFNNEPALYIDATYWQFNPQYRETIIASSYQSTFKKFALKAIKDIFKEKVDKWCKKKNTAMSYEEALEYLEAHRFDSEFYHNENEIYSEYMDYLGHGEIRSGKLIDFGKEVEEKIKNIVAALTEMASSGHDYGVAMETKETKSNCPESLKYNVAIKSSTLYEQFQPVKIKVSFINGSPSLEILKGSLTEEQQAILKNRLKEMLTHLPQAPPEEVIIWITPETTAVDITNVGKCRIVSEYDTATCEIRLYPIFIETDTELSRQFNVSPDQAKKFLTTALRDEFGHVLGLNQEEGDNDTLKWLEQDENRDYLEANIAILDKNNQNGVYPVEDWHERLIVRLLKHLYDKIEVLRECEMEGALCKIRSYLASLKEELKSKGVDLERNITIDEVIVGLRTERGKKRKDTELTKKVKGELSEIVNNKDEPVGVTEAGISHMFGLGHRTSNCFVFSPSGKLILQRRVHNKLEAKRLSIFGGHVKFGSSYEKAIREELLEELSLDEIEMDLQNEPIRIGEEGQFMNDDFQNTEFRSLYIYILSDDEYQHILLRKEYIDAKRVECGTVEEFEAWIDAEQKAKSGYGEVWGYHIFDLLEIVNSQDVAIREKYGFGEIEERVSFTGDLLRPLVSGTAAIRKDSPEIHPMQRIEYVLEGALENTPFYGVYLQERNLRLALRDSRKYYDTVAVVLKREHATYMEKYLREARGYVMPADSQIMILDFCQHNLQKDIFNNHKGPLVLICIIDEEIEEVLSAVIETLCKLQNTGCIFDQNNLAMIVCGGKGTRNYPLTAVDGLGNKGLMRGINGEPSIYQTLRQAMQFYQQNTTGVTVFEVDKVFSICRALPKLDEKDVQIFGNIMPLSWPFMDRHPKVEVDSKSNLVRLMREGGTEEAEFLRGKKEAMVSTLLAMYFSKRAINTLFEKNLDLKGNLVHKALRRHREFLLKKEEFPGIVFGFIDTGRDTFYLHVGYNFGFRDGLKLLFCDLAFRELMNVRIDSRTGAIIGSDAKLAKDVIVGPGAVILGRTELERGRVASGALVMDSRVRQIEAEPDSWTIAVEEKSDLVVYVRRGEILSDARIKEEGRYRKERIVLALFKDQKEVWDEPLPGINKSRGYVSEHLDYEAIYAFMTGRMHEGSASEVTSEIPYSMLRKFYRFKHIAFIKILFGGGSSKIEESPMLIIADANRYVLRCLNDEQIAQHIISYQIKLKEEGIPVSAIIKTQEGKYYFTDSGRIYYLEEYLHEGREVKYEELTEKHYAGMGRMAARIQNATEDFQPEGRNICKLREEIGEHITEFHRREQELMQKQAQGQALSEAERVFLEIYSLLVEQIELFKQSYRQFLDYEYPNIAIHGDLAYTNLRFDQDGNVVGVFDLARAHKTKRIVELNQIIFGRMGIGMVSFNKYYFLSALESYQKEINHKLTTQEILAILDVFRSRFIEDLRNSLVNREHRYYVSPEIDHYRKRLEDVKAVIENFKRFIKYAQGLAGILISIQKEVQKGADEQKLIQGRIFEAWLSQGHLPFLTVSYQSLNKRTKSLLLIHLAELFYYEPDSDIAELCIRALAQKSQIAWRGIITKKGKMNILASVAVLRELMLNPILTNKAVYERLFRNYGLTSNNVEQMELTSFIRSQVVLQDLLLWKSRRPRMVSVLKKITNNAKKIENILDHKFTPLTGEIHTGITCGKIRCRFCYNAICTEDGTGTMLEPVDYVGKDNALNREEIKALVDDYLASGIQEIYVSGGKEPWYSKHTIGLIRYIREKSNSVVISMLTIGLALKREEVREAAVECMDIVRISLDAGSPEVYDYIKGLSNKIVEGNNSGTFEEVRDGIQRTLELRNAYRRERKPTRLRVGMSFLCHEDNYEQLEKFLKLAQEWGVDFVEIKGLLANPKSEKIEGFMDYACSMYDRVLMGEFEGLDVYFHEIFFRNTGRRYGFDEELRKSTGDIVGKCFLALAGLRTIAVVPNGRVFVCVNSGQPGYDSRHGAEWDKFRLGLYKGGVKISDLVEQHKQTSAMIKPGECEQGTTTDEMINQILWKLHLDKQAGFSLENQPVVPDPDKLYYDGRAIYHKCLGCNEIEESQLKDRLLSVDEFMLQLPGVSESAQNIIPYVNSRLPKEVREALNDENVGVEICLGETSKVNKYLKILARDGSRIIKSISVSNFYSPTAETYYKVEDSDGRIRIMISSVKGKTRALRFLAILHYLNISRQRITIRDFETDWISVYKKEVSPYFKNNIRIAVVVLNPENIARSIKNLCSDTQCQDVHTKNLHFVMMKIKNDQLVLFDLLDLYGSQIRALLQWILLPAHSCGLSAKEVLLLGECGGIGADVKLGDIVLPNAVWTAESSVEPIINSIPLVEISKLLKGKSSRIHTGLVETIPAIMLESKSKVEEDRKRGILALELELAYVAEVCRLFGDVKVGALLKVVDLPGQKHQCLGELGMNDSCAKGNISDDLISLLIINSIIKSSVGKQSRVSFPLQSPAMTESYLKANKCNYSVAIKPLSQCEQFQPARVRVNFINGKAKIKEVLQGSLNLEQKQLTEKRLDLMLPQLPHAPPEEVIIWITPETTTVDIADVGRYRIISEYDTATCEIRLYPIFIEVDTELSRLFNATLNQAQKFLTTALRDEVGHALGLNQEEGDKDTLKWLEQEENRDYLEANIAILDRNNQNGVYQVGGFLFGAVVATNLQVNIDFLKTSKPHIRKNILTPEEITENLDLSSNILWSLIKDNAAAREEFKRRCVMLSENKLLETLNKKIRELDENGEIKIRYRDFNKIDIVLFGDWLWRPANDKSNDLDILVIFKGEGVARGILTGSPEIPAIAVNFINIEELKKRDSAVKNLGRLLLGSGVVIAGGDFVSEIRFNDYQAADILDWAKGLVDAGVIELALGSLGEPRREWKRYWDALIYIEHLLPETLKEKLRIFLEEYLSKQQDGQAKANLSGESMFKDFFTRYYLGKLNILPWKLPNSSRFIDNFSCLISDFVNELSRQCAKLEVKKFPDGELYLRIENQDIIKGADIVVNHSFDTPEDLVKAVLIADILRMHEAASIKLVLDKPYNTDSSLFDLISCFYDRIVYRNARDVSLPKLSKLDYTRAKQLPVWIHNVLFQHSRLHDDARAAAEVINAKHQRIRIIKYQRNPFNWEIRIPKDLEGKNVVLVHSTENSVDIVELWLILTALRRSGIGVICLINSFEGYSRQDKVFNPGEGVSALTMLKAIDSFADNHMVLNVHYGNASGWVEKSGHKLYNLNAFVQVAEKLFDEVAKRAGKRNIAAELKNHPVFLIAPDDGAFKYIHEAADVLSSYIQEEYGVHTIVRSGYMDKKRVSSTEVRYQGKLLNAEGKVISDASQIKDSWAFVIDDETSHGSTLLSATYCLVRKLGVSWKRIFCGVVHGKLVRGLEPFNTGWEKQGLKNVLEPKPEFINEEIGLMPPQLIVSTASVNLFRGFPEKRKVPISRIIAHAVKHIIGKGEKDCGAVVVTKTESLFVPQENVLDKSQTVSLEEFISSDTEMFEYSIRINKRIESISHRIGALVGENEEAGQLVKYLQDGIEVIYRWIPMQMFKSYYTEKTAVPGHALSHALDVLERSLDIIDNEQKDIQKTVNFKLLITAVLMHDLSCIVSRQYHVEKSALWLQAILDRDGKLSKEDIVSIVEIAKGHEKIQNGGIREEHKKFIESRILHDADMLCATFDLERIYETWVRWSEDETSKQGVKINKFYNSQLSLDDRIEALRQGYHYSKTDGVTNIVLQGGVRRDPKFYLTKGGKEIVRRAGKGLTPLLNFIDTKREHLKSFSSYLLTDGQVDEIKNIIKELYVALFETEENVAISKGNPQNKPIILPSINPLAVSFVAAVFFAYPILAALALVVLGVIAITKIREPNHKEVVRCIPTMNLSSQGLCPGVTASSHMQSFRSGGLNTIFLLSRTALLKARRILANGLSSARTLVSSSARKLGASLRTNRGAFTLNGKCALPILFLPFKKAVSLIKINLGLRAQPEAIYLSVAGGDRSSAAAHLNQTGKMDARSWLIYKNHIDGIFEPRKKNQKMNPFVVNLTGPVDNATKKEEPKLDITDIGTVGTHNIGWREKHTRYRLEHSIDLSKGYVVLSLEDGKFTIHKSENASSIDTELMSKVVAVSNSSRMKKFIDSNIGDLANLTIYLLDPSERTKLELHPHLLTVQGKNFEIATSGTSLGKQQAVYITRAAFIDLEKNLLISILMIQIELAIARYKLWHQGKPFSFGNINSKKVSDILLKVREDKLIKKEIKASLRYDIELEKKFSLDMDACDKVERFLRILANRLPNFAPAITSLERFTEFMQAIKEFDYFTAVEIWGLMTYELRELMSPRKDVPKEYFSAAGTRAFLSRVQKINSVLNDYIFEHGIYSQGGEEYGKAVGIVRVVDDPAKVEESLNNAEGNEIWVLPYLPVSREEIPGVACIISVAGNQHAIDAAKEQCIPLAVIPNAVELLRCFDNYACMLRVETDKDIRFRLAFCDETGLPRERRVKSIKVPLAKIGNRRIFWLKEIDRHFVYYVGSKAVNLGDMINAGVNIPEGFVLAFNFWQKFSEYGGLDGKIASIRAKIIIQDGKVLNSQEELKGLLQGIKDLIINAEFPEELKQELFSYIGMLRKIYGHVGFYIRSSLNFEDLTEKTTAGYYDSYPDDTFKDTSSDENILTAIKKVFASKWNERAFNARALNTLSFPGKVVKKKEEGQEEEKIDVDKEVMPAVIIQVPAKAEFAGTMYTASPYSYSFNEICIKASFGQGQAVVGSSGKAAEVIVNKITGERKTISSHSLADIEYQFADGAMQASFVSPERRSRAIFTAELVKRLKELGEKIEGMFDFRPQDIEWVYGKDGQIWVVQSRPMKTEKLPTEKSFDDELLGKLSNVDEEAMIKLMRARQSLDVQSLLEGLHMDKPTTDDRIIGERTIAARYLGALAENIFALEKITINDIKNVIEFLKRKYGSAIELVLPSYPPALLDLLQQVEFFTHDAGTKAA
ncbi:MAG: NAD-dependent epimerase/dehydratase family protein, partial [Candidatus Omnitrophica bacterium]|nr:NAD-dependent epimerase/dehydratase family protein [Candidatus Omnitrophota bacterium]